MIRAMPKPLLTLFLALWACLALPLQAVAHGGTMLPASTMQASHDHAAAANQDAHAVHHDDEATHHSCCFADTPDTGCADTGNVSCATACLGTTSALVAIGMPLHPLQSRHDFGNSPLIGALAPAYTLPPLRPPA